MTEPGANLPRKHLEWIAGAKRALKTMPEEVQDQLGFAIDRLQIGRHPVGAKPFGERLPAEVMKLTADEKGETYRAASVVAFAGIVYVLDVFHKKSKSGNATPKPDKERVKQRFQLAKAHYEAHKHTYAVSGYRPMPHSEGTK